MGRFSVMEPFEGNIIVYPVMYKESSETRDFCIKADEFIFYN
jgi:hypothetical protein